MESSDHVVWEKLGAGSGLSITDSLDNDFALFYCAFLTFVIPNVILRLLCVFQMNLGPFCALFYCAV